MTMVLEEPITSQLATEEEIFDNEGSDASSESPMSSADSGLSDSIGDNDTIVTLSYKPYHGKDNSSDSDKDSLPRVWDKENEESGRESGIDSDGSECPLDKQSVVSSLSSPPTNSQSQEGDLTSLESVDSECSEVTLVTNLETGLWLNMPSSGTNNHDVLSACLEEREDIRPLDTTFSEVTDLIHSDSDCTSIENSMPSINSLNLDSISNETLVGELTHQSHNSNSNLNLVQPLQANPVSNENEPRTAEAAAAETAIAATVADKPVVTSSGDAVSANCSIEKQDSEQPRCSVSSDTSSCFSSLDISSGNDASSVISSPEILRPQVWDRLSSDPDEIALKGKAFFDHRLKKAEAMKVKWSSSLELDKDNTSVQKSSATSHFHEKMGRLILDLSGLSSQDSALFNQLLTLNNSINTLREQCLPLDGSISDDDSSLSSLSEGEEPADTDSDRCLLRVYSPTSTLSSNSSAGSCYSKRPTQRRLSQGSFVRQRVSYPPTAKNRLSRNASSRPKVRRTSQEVFV